VQGKCRFVPRLHRLCWAGAPQQRSSPQGSAAAIGHLRSFFSRIFSLDEKLKTVPKSRKEAWDEAAAQFWCRKFYPEDRTGQIKVLAEHKPKRRDYQLHAELDTLGLPESGLTTHREPNTRAPSLSHREVCLSGAKRQKSIPSIRRSDR
jgi:hypothetical protein